MKKIIIEPYPFNGCVKFRHERKCFYIDEDHDSHEPMPLISCRENFPSWKSV